MLASGSNDKTVRLWDIRGGNNTLILKGHTDSISSIAYAPNGRHFISGSYDTTVRVWDMLTNHTDSIPSIVFSSNGPHFVPGNNDTTVRVWDVSTEDSINMLTNHTDRVSSVTYSPDGQNIVSASWDMSVRIWSSSPPFNQVSVLRGATKIITGLSVSPAGLAQVAACCNDKTVRLWDATPSISDTFAIGTETESNGHIGGVSAIAISHDCQQLATGGYDTTVRTFDLTTGHSLGSPLRAHKRSVAAVAFSPTAQALVSASWDHTIHLWDTERRELSKVIRGHLASVTSLAFLPSGHLISGSADWTIRLWNLGLDSQEPIRTFKGHTQGVRSVACSRDGFRIASASEDKTVRVWTLTADLEKTEDVFEGHSDVVACVTFSPDGRQIASASEDKSIRLWNIEGSGSESTVLLGHRAGVQCVAYSTCGTCLASGSDDSSVIVWSVLTNCKMTIIGDVFGGISSIVWKQGGLIVGCKDGSVRAWRLLVEEDRAQVRLEWGTGFGYLVATDAHIGGALKLGSVAFELLKQRGAVGEMSREDNENEIEE
ncbi:U3 small nucleolar RNA-associated protein 13 [Linnemannia elongata]|nr:U3 small nucleolar RNA-associated protein 13 [Linnemannia elongata]